MTLGLIAGQGRFPIEAAQSARRNGKSVVAVAFHDLFDPDLEKEVDDFHLIYLGELGKLLGILHEGGCESVLLAGKIPKTVLFQNLASLKLDARALALAAQLKDQLDDSVLGLFAGALAEEGFSVLEQADACPELIAEPGTIGSHTPDDEQRADIAFAWPIAKALGGLDVGQTVVVHKKAVLALEAIEGTDEAIRRGGALGGRGACVVKVAKPSQDPRFDVPAVGPQTLQVAQEAGISVIAVEAGKTLLLDREALIAEADRSGIAMVGVHEGEV